MEKSWMRPVGAALVVLVTAFLALDAGMKIAGVAAAVDATRELGFSPVATRTIGLILAIATLVYVVPVTRILGAVLLTGYLGGAVAIQAANGSPLATHILFGVYVGAAVWASIWLRNAQIRSLLPLAQRADA